MAMTSKFVLMMPVGAIALVLASGAFAQRATSPAGREEQQRAIDAAWRPLRKDVSRAELFKRVIAAKLVESGERKPSTKALPGTKGKPFLFPQDAQFDAGKPRENAIFGVDISHYTSPDLDFGALKAQGIWFVYAKATQGTGFKDGRFADFWKRLAALPDDQKILRGAYHFLSSSGDANSQADSFLKFMALNGGFQAGDLPAVLDLEWDPATTNGPDRWIGQSPAQIIGKALAWLQKVEDVSGKIPMLYTSRTWWQGRQIPESDIAKLAHFKIWIADYSIGNRATETPAVPQNAKWHLWQFSEAARISRGYSGGMDANIYKGSKAQFLAEFQLPPS